jgi:glutathione synthase/RimK-type ligase-like ATP-grasp enzyme
MGAGTGASNNLIRSLRTGDPALVLIGCHADRFSLKQSSADRNYLTPSPAHPGFLPGLRGVVDAERIDLLVPSTDADVRAISGLRRRIPCRLFLPRHSVIELCQDKYELTRFLRSRGVPAPLTYPVTGLGGIDRAFRRLAPRRSLVWCRIRRGHGSAGAMPVKRAEQARNWIRHWEETRGVPARLFTLSEYLPGRDFACQSLWKAGELVLIKTFERLSHMASGSQASGVSSVATLSRTVREPSVARVCAAAIRSLDPRASGVFCADLKEDARGVPCITEVNAGRFSLSTNIYDLVGKHNMAAAYVGLALGDRIDIRERYDAVEDYYMVRDVDTLPGIFHAEAFLDGMIDARPAPRASGDRRISHNRRARHGRLQRGQA